ncbi:hypothetical protein PENSPDRAFT_657474 [Peniophora sp. CONT]|nr:hypothetical protein PENSPDRAFT_657474 [Peniophora sp. CONT]
MTRGIYRRSPYDVWSRLSRQPPSPRRRTIGTSCTTRREMDYSATLPAETLLDIFHAARLVNSIPTSSEIARRVGSKWGLDPDKYTAYLLAWVPITHVCARWRKLALDDARLWTEVPVLLGVKWMREFISRSNGLPISLDWESTRYKYAEHMLPELEGIVPTHYQRLRNFHGSGLDATAPLLPYLARPWPVLEDLRVQLLEDIPGYVLLANDAPRLRHLSFTRGRRSSGSFPWAAPFLRTLISLDVQTHKDIYRASMDRVLDALDSMPHLQHLSLGHTEPLSASLCPSCFPESRRVTLPLQTLALRSMWSGMSHMISHIEAPASARIALTLNRERGDPGNSSVNSFRLACTQMSSTEGSSSPPPLPFRSLQLRGNRSAVQVYASRTSTFADVDRRSEYSWYDQINGVHPDLAISSPCNVSLDTLCSALHGFADVRMLSISLDSYIPPSSIFNSTFLAVIVLRLEYASGTLPGVMLMTPDESGMITSFPALRVLEVQTCSLKDVVSEDATTESYIFNILSARRQAGVPVHIVYLRLADEIDDLRNGRCSYYLDAAAVERAVDVLMARPDVRIIGKDEVVPYAAYL